MTIDADIREHREHVDRLHRQLWEEFSRKRFFVKDLEKENEMGSKWPNKFSLLLSELYVDKKLDFNYHKEYELGTQYVRIFYVKPIGFPMSCLQVKSEPKAKVWRI